MERSTDSIDTPPVLAVTRRDSAPAVSGVYVIARR
jgi:hypothetical protein